MQHQQAERRSLLHVGARDIELKGGRGDGGQKDLKKPPASRWPDRWGLAVAEQC